MRNFNVQGPKSRKVSSFVSGVLKMKSNLVEFSRIGSNSVEWRMHRPMLDASFWMLDDGGSREVVFGGVGEAQGPFPLTLPMASQARHEMDSPG